MDGNVKQQNCGIYKIKNLINGKVYIGQSVCLQKRWNDHKARAKDINYNNHLYSAIRKYGIENFKYSIIEYCTKDELNDREVYWISYYDSTNREKGYNIRYGGESGGNYYNYEKIYKEWLNGKTCKELEVLFHCGDSVVTNALRYYGIDEFQVRSRANQKNKYVALSRDKKPLKIFTAHEIMIFFKKNKSEMDSFYSSINLGYKSFGYYWEYLTDENMPIKEITDEEFLSYQIPPEKVYTKEEKLQMSLRMRTVERPNRTQLKELIRTSSFTEIGKIYNVTDNAIRKWCDFENLPTRKRDINSYSDEEWEQI